MRHEAGRPSPHGHDCQGRVRQLAGLRQCHTLERDVPAQAMPTVRRDLPTIPTKPVSGQSISDVLEHLGSEPCIASRPWPTRRRLEPRSCRAASPSQERRRVRPSWARSACPRASRLVREACMRVGGDVAAFCANVRFICGYLQPSFREGGTPLCVWMCVCV